MSSWLADTFFARAVGDSVATFAAVEGLHIVALAVLGGSVLVANLAGAGALVPAESALRVERGLRVPMWSGLAAAALTGFLLFATSPEKYLTNPLFTVKLVLLGAALAVQFIRGRRVLRAGANNGTRALAIAALVLWLGVVTAGRWIGLI